MIGNPTAGRRARQPGWWYPWIFIGGMTVVVVVNIVLAVAAVRTFPGLETNDAYRKGLAYNDVLAAARAQAARGWQVAVAFVPDSGRGAGELQVVFRDRDGRPLDGLRVGARLTRPLGAEASQTADLQARGDGLYAAHVALPFAGQWDADIHAGGNTEQFQTRQRLRVP